jgi:hypothetical protein
MIESSPIIGRVVSAGGTQLTVDVAKKGDAPSERTIDREALARIERSTGFQSRVGTGALIGAGVGVLAGAGALYVMMEESGEGPFPITLPLWYGAIGTLAGAAVGAAASGERWSTLPSDVRIGLQLGAPSVPLAVGIGVSF